MDDTIIVGKLDDKQLRESIDKLVSYVDTKTVEMAKSFDSAVDRMNRKLKELGSNKIDLGGSSDGGSSRRTKAQNEETDAIEKAISARDKQIKKNQEVSMSFDQIAEALSKARGVVRDFNINRQNGLPSTEEYNKYEQALARIVEYNDKLKLSALEVAQANEKAFSFDPKRAANISPVDDRLKQLNRYYAEQEKMSKNAEQKRISAIEKESAAQKKLIDEQYKLAYARANKIPTDNIDLVQAKLERLQTLLRDMRERGILNNTQIASTEAEIRRLESLIGNIAQAQNIATNSAVQYTEEIRKQAQAIRDSAQWREKGYAVVNGVNVYNLEKDTTPLKSRISLEEQLLQLHKSEESSMLQQAVEEEKVAQATRLTGEELKKIYQDQKAVNEEINKRANGVRNGGTTPFQSYESLRQSIASVLGIQEQQVKMTSTENGAYNQLSSTLKQLKMAYDSLSKTDRNSDQGKVLVASIHEVERAMQKIRLQAARPVSLESIIGINGKGGLTEKTLDDIAYKIQRLTTYRLGLNITDPKEKQEIEQVNQALDKLKKKQSEIMGQNKDLLASNNALVRSFNYMKNRLAFYFTVGASTQFVKQLIEIRSQYEMNERALGILINSAERGSQIFKELSDMALVSPYTLIELSSAAKQLTAYDIAARDVVDTTRRLADMTAAVGIPIERLTYAIGQVKAYGYLNARDARMFSNAGIPLIKELADYYTQLEGRIVSVADVYDKINKKAIDYNDVMSVVTKMTDEGGKFFDFQAKMAGTLKVQLANLTLAWNNMLNDIGSDSQGMLSTTIGGLKELFLHWKDIDKIIKTVVIAFGLWKAAQLTALAVTGQLTGAMAMQIVMGEKLQAKMASMAAGLKTASIGISAAGMAFWVVLADAIMTYRRNVEEIEKLNKSIAEGAKESADSIRKMLEGSEMQQNYLSAKTGKLAKSDAEKTWEALREQIELSSASAKDIIPTLMNIEDANERVTKAFDLASRIADANDKLSDMNDNLDVSQDTILFGAFGEGLAEDIDDYNERIKYTTEVAEYAAKKNKGFWENAVMGIKALFETIKEDLGNSEDEAVDEIRKFAAKAANVIKDELGEEGVKDKVQVNEAIARVIQGMEKRFPKIKGKGKALFESIFYDVMANEFEGAVDKQAYYYNLFLNQLKKDHASAFQGVTNDIVNDTHIWSEAQLNAIKKTAEKVKTDIPYASQDAINQILKQLNSTEFKLRIVTEFATTAQDKVNELFKEHFINKPWLENSTERQNEETAATQKYGALMKKVNETNLEYEDRIRKKREENVKISEDNANIIEANKNKTDEASKAIVANAKEEKKAADDFLSAAEEVADWGGYNFSTKKENRDATKAQKEAETELAKALKDELQLIEKVRSTYKDLTKEEINREDAISAAINGYEKSVANINSVLGKYGLNLDLSKFAGITNPIKLREMLVGQLNALFGKAKPAEIQALEVEIQKVDLDVTKFNQKTITDSLNNELGKLKEEYELAVTLDADPELGSAFADMMGINMDNLPRTVQQYADRYTEYLNKYLNESNAGIELPHLNLTNDELRVYEEMVKNEQMTEATYERIKKAVMEIRDIRRKDIEDQIKNWSKLIEKYGAYEDKINALQNATAKERVTFVKQFGTEEQTGQAIKLSADIQAATDPNERNRLIGQLKALVNDIAGNDETRLKLKVAIDKSELEVGAKYAFEEFQKTPEWVTATGNLADMSKSAIRTLIADIEHYKRTAKNLTPKQIKDINKALKQLYTEQRKNNPFAAISNMLDEAKERAENFNIAIADTEKELEELQRVQVSNQNKGIIDPKTDAKIEKTNKRLAELIKKKNELDKPSASAWVESIRETIGAIEDAISLVDGLVKAISGVEESDLDKIFSVVSAAGQGAATGAKVGGTYGAIIGAVLGAGTKLTQILSNAYNENINKQIKYSEDNVKLLATAYNKLKRSIDEAYGADYLGSKKLQLANKQMELVEVQRQLQLERSRKNKNKDFDKITELEDKVDELQHEIKNAAKNIIMDLTGISDSEDWAESLVDNMIDAFKKGEDYMESYKDSFDDMIDSMIAKAIVGRLIGDRIEEMFKMIYDRAEQRAETDESVLNAKKEMDDIQAAYDLIMALAHDKGTYVSDEVMSGYQKALEEAQEKYAKAYSNAARPTPEDVQSVRDMSEGWRDDVKKDFEEYMSLFGIEFGSEKAKKELSALQQGIQGITETTAGALEAITNGMYQQVTLQSDILQQINTTLQNFDLDIQTATLSQILLQLQSSYILQQSILSTMENWTTPSGNAVKVELIS